MTIKSYFGSRYGSDGVLLQADFSQLEVIVLAWLSQDPLLIEDIVSGMDLHCQSAAFITGKDYQYIYDQVQSGDQTWVNIRKASKAPSFQLSYGAGYKGIAAKTTLSESQAKKFITNYYDRYTCVKEWQEEQIALVAGKAVYSGRITPKGFPSMKSQLVTATGRRLTFHEQDTPDFIKEATNFSPTKIKNYPVQGTAYDIVALAISSLWDHIKTAELERVHFVNTIHDSVLKDLHKDSLTSVLKYVRPCLTNIDALMQDRYGVEFNLPISVDIEVGPTWHNMETLDARTY